MCVCVCEGDLFPSTINYDAIDEKSKYLFHMIATVYECLKYLYIFRHRLRPSPYAPATVTFLNGICFFV